MTCGHCASTITKALRASDPQAKVEISLPDKRVRVDSTLSPEQLAQCIADAGFQPQATS